MKFIFIFEDVEYVLNKSHFFFIICKISLRNRSLIINLGLYKNKPSVDGAKEPQASHFQALLSLSGSWAR